MDNRFTKIGHYYQELVVKVVSGNATPEEHDELEEWLQLSMDHRMYYHHIRQTWLVSSVSGGSGWFDGDQAWEDTRALLKGSTGRKRWSDRQFLWRAAAVFVLAFSAGSITMYMGMRSMEETVNPMAQMNEITAPLGSKSRVMLPDSTVVWLNAGSRLRYAQTYNETGRDVDLVGEGYFQVRTNAAKPFVVHTGGVKVRAYGTAFNVKAYPEEKTITTTLVEGKVDVETLRTGGGEPIRLTLKPRQNVVITRGMEESGSLAVEEESVQVSAGEESQAETSPVVVASDIKTTLYTSWKDENWIVERVNLDDFIVMVGRRFDVDFVYKSEDLKQYKISGTIRKETLEQVLDLLKLTTPLKYRIREGVVTLDYDASRSGNYQQVMHELQDIQ